MGKLLQNMYTVAKMFIQEMCHDIKTKLIQLTT